MIVLFNPTAALLSPQPGGMGKRSKSKICRLSLIIEAKQIIIIMVNGNNNNRKET